MIKRIISKIGAVFSIIAVLLILAIFVLLYLRAESLNIYEGPKGNIYLRTVDGVKEILIFNDYNTFTLYSYVEDETNSTIPIIGAKTIYNVGGFEYNQILGPIHVYPSNRNDNTIMLLFNLSFYNHKRESRSRIDIEVINNYHYNLNNSSVFSSDTYEKVKVIETENSIKISGDKYILASVDEISFAKNIMNFLDINCELVD